jgi:hypothetical protein
LLFYDLNYFCQMNTVLKRYFLNFKSKWNVRSNWQLFKIMIVFSLAGQSILFTLPVIKVLLGVPNDINTLYKVLFFIFFSFPLYQIYLLFWSILLGEMKFFVHFIKKTFKKSSRLFNYLKIK